jgi:hypothetical protein
LAHSSTASSAYWRSSPRGGGSVINIESNVALHAVARHPTAPIEIGQITGRQRHGPLLVLQTLDHSNGPSSARHGRHLSPIQAVV